MDVKRIGVSPILHLYNIPYQTRNKQQIQIPRIIVLTTHTQLIWIVSVQWINVCWTLRGLWMVTPIEFKMCICSNITLSEVSFIYYHMKLIVSLLQKMFKCKCMQVHSHTCHDVPFEIGLTSFFYHSKWRRRLHGYHLISGCSMSHCFRINKFITLQCNSGQFR